MIIKLKQKLLLYAEFVKFEHSVFALPFALSAGMLALGPDGLPKWHTLLWMIIAMVSGRTYAMGLNRIADAKWDALNERTANRSLPAGRIKAIEAWTFTLVSLAVMAVATFQLPILCVYLLPVAILVLTLYSFVKRFSWLCHFVCGLALGCGAIGGWVAVSGTLPWSAFFWGLGVLFWVAGFDLLYACQDVEFDQQHGLYSVPACFGLKAAFICSKVCHTLTLVCFAITALLLGWPSTFYWMALILAACLLIYEHRLVSPNNLGRINEAFFVVNGVISIGVMILIGIDKRLL